MHPLRCLGVLVEIRPLKLTRMNVVVERGGESELAGSSQPGCSGAGCRIPYMYIGKIHDDYMAPRLPTLDQDLLIENTNQFCKESPPRHRGCELRPAATEPAGFAGHRPVGDLPRSVRYRRRKTRARGRWQAWARASRGMAADEHSTGRQATGGDAPGTPWSATPARQRRRPR